MSNGSLTRATSSPLTIGIRDSGVGGLTVARCIKAALPGARLLYFADTAHVPYGDRTPDEVRHYALSISEFLIEQGAQTLIFACNTSSALALDLARERFDVPIWGTIEPGARAALNATRNGCVGVIATRATVESGVYGTWLHRLNPDVCAVEEACPSFVPLVENEQTESEDARVAALRHMQRLRAAGCDTVVLGCTHYPLLLPALREAAPEMVFVDPAEGLTREVQARLGRSAADRAGSTIREESDLTFASGERDSVARWIQKLLPDSRAQVQPGPVFDLVIA